MIYFVTEQFFKENTPAGENVDFKRVQPWVKVAAQTRIKNVLGSVFYAEILAKYNNESLNTKEIELVEKVKDAVCWFALQLALPDINKAITNKGQQKQKGDFTEPAESNDETRGIDSYLSTAKYYLQELREFLEERKADYPTFSQEQNKDSKGFEGTENKNDSFNDSLLII